MNYSGKQWMGAILKGIPAGLMLAGLCIAMAGWMTLARAEPGDAAFLSAREAARTGDRARLDKQLAILRATPGYPLKVMAEYWQLRMRIDDQDETAVQDFLATNAGSYLADRLRGDWLRQLGKRGEWERFNRELPQLMQSDNEITCYGALAERKPETMRGLWLSGAELPRSCDLLVDQWVAAGGLKLEDVWQRIRRSFEMKRVGQARAAAAYLPPSEGFGDHHLLESIAQNPARYLDKLPTEFGKTRGGREVVLFALQRQARNDPRDAAKRLLALEGMTGKAGGESVFRDEERAYAWGQIAWQAALRHMPEALAWYDKATASPLGEEAHAWQARAALRARDWAALRRIIGAMPPAMAAQPEWIYWLGRALAAQDRRMEARALYSRIAGQANFYGNLADEELGRTISIPAQAAPVTDDELKAAEANAGLQRSLALFRLDMRVEAIREWNWAIRSMGDRQLLAAAELARRNELWDRAINTANQTQSQHDFTLRFIAPFKDQVAPKATALDLDSGWVYGLMRQESRFITKAKSTVGAQGLMQVMPATARWVAKKINLVYHPSQATDMDTNVTLGTNYLKMVLDSLDRHPVLASAAYNAGPGRAGRWRGDTAMEGAIYAETIPFSETRDYVKKVMSNTVYYAMLFDAKPQSLRSRLSVIRPRGQGETGVDELP